MADTDLITARISVDPTIMVGKPVVRGTRIPVERVLLHLEEYDHTDLFAAFPELTDDDVRACLVSARVAVERLRAQPVETATRS